MNVGTNLLKESLAPKKLGSQGRKSSKNAQTVKCEALKEGFRTSRRLRRRPKSYGWVRVEVQSQWLNSYKCLGYICLLCSSMPPWCNSRNILFGHVLGCLRGELLVGHAWPHVITIHSSPNGLPRVCLGIICLEITKRFIRLSWNCQRIAWRLPQDCLWIANDLPLHCQGFVLGLPRDYLGIASVLVMGRVT